MFWLSISLADDFLVLTSVKLLELNDLFNVLEMACIAFDLALLSEPPASDSTDNCLVPFELIILDGSNSLEELDAEDDDE